MKRTFLVISVVSASAWAAWPAAPGPGPQAQAQPSAVDVAWNLLKEDQLERAIEPLRAELKKTPNHALLRYALGLCLAHAGETRQALAELNLSAKLDRSFPQTWYYLRTLTPPGDPAELAALRRAAAKSRKSDPHIHLNYGLMLLHAGRTDAALRQFQTAADLSAAYAEAHFEIGAVRYDQGRFDDAVASLRKALGIDPDYAEARRLLALALAAKGLPADEVETLRKQALDLKPELQEAEDVLLILSDKEGRRNWERNLEKVGKLYLAPLKTVGLILSPLVPFLEREPVGRTMLMATSSKTASGWQVGPSTTSVRGAYSKIAIKWTSSKHLEPLPMETLADPDNFPFTIRLGGRKLLWALFTTPNYRFIAQPSGPGLVSIELRRIPPVQVRFDPDGTLVRKGVYAAGLEFPIDGQWDAKVEDVGADTVRLLIRRKR
ncbi:MAG: tetratricopeptide repeat protein [Elusimicrobia bacterium]|nr:tetratricopeptide repeat protein [Elusimicrobiota bacterium]